MIQKYWNGKLPQNPLFKLLQIQKSIVLSAHSKIPTSSTATSIFLRNVNCDLDIVENIQKQQHQKQFSTQQGLKVFDYQSQNATIFVSKMEGKYDLSPLENMISNQKFIKLKQFCDADYFKFVNQKVALYANLGKENFGIFKFKQNIQQPYENYTWNSVQLLDSSLCGITAHSSHKILLTSTTDPDFLHQPTCLSEFDIQYLTPTFKYQNPREVITSEPVPINNFCVLVGHLKQSDNQSYLAVHDTRTKNSGIVSIVDSTQRQFGNVTWFPHYYMMAIRDCELITVWGSPAAKISHLIRLDFRKPFDRQIFSKNVEHPRFLYLSKKERNCCWVIRNQYQMYRYQQSYLEKHKYI